MDTIGTQYNNYIILIIVNYHTSDLIKGHTEWLRLF